MGSIPGSGRSPGEGNGNLLQYSCLENPMDRGAWQAKVQGVAKSQTQLSDWTVQPSLLKRLRFFGLSSTLKLLLTKGEHFKLCLNFIPTISSPYFNCIQYEESACLWLFIEHVRWETAHGIGPYTDTCILEGDFRFQDQWIWTNWHQLLAFVWAISLLRVVTS